MLYLLDILYWYGLAKAVCLSLYIRKCIFSLLHFNETDSARFTFSIYRYIYDYSYS